MASVDDIDALRALLADAWRQTYARVIGEARVAAMIETALAPSALRASLERPGAIALTAVSAGDVAGLLAARRTGDGAHVDRLYVAARAQRRGVGAALLRALQKRLGAAARITLHVEVSNAAAIAFYERAGFVAIGRTRENVAGADFEVLVLARPGAVTATANTAPRNPAR